MWEEEEPSQRKPHPSSSSHPSPALFLAPVCPASSLPRQGLALRSSGTLREGGWGGPHCKDPIPPRSLPPATTVTLDPAAVPQPPRHGTTRHGMARRWGPAVQYAGAGSDPPAHWYLPLHRPQHCQMSPGLSPSCGGMGGSSVPQSWGHGEGGRAPGAAGKEACGGGDGTSRDGVPPYVGTGDGTYARMGTVVTASLLSWGHWGPCLSRHPGDVLLWVWGPGNAASLGLGARGLFPSLGQGLWGRAPTMTRSTVACLSTMVRGDPRVVGQSLGHGRGGGVSTAAPHSCSQRGDLVTGWPGCQPRD